MIKKRLLYWLPVVIILAVIFYLSSQSDFPGEKVLNIPFMDKIGHLIEYFILGIFIFRALRYCENMAIKKALIITIVFSGIYGITDEIHQLAVPNRYCSLFDWMADCFGSVAVTLFSNKI